MGAVYGSQIEKPGEYVLSLLRESPSIIYSKHFFDGTEELQKRIVREMELDEDLADQVACLVDIAVWQLADQGLVTTTKLEEFMTDGEHDYRIELTEKGRALLADSRDSTITFRDMHL